MGRIPNRTIRDALETAQFGHHQCIYFTDIVNQRIFRQIGRSQQGSDQVLGTPARHISPIFMRGRHPIPRVWIWSSCTVSGQRLATRHVYFPRLCVPGTERRYGKGDALLNGCAGQTGYSMPWGRFGTGTRNGRCGKYSSSPV